MKFKLFYAVMLALVVFVMAGCGPPKIEPIREIKPNETAFLVPLEGQAMGGQAKFMSVAYLDSSKVATKRVVFPIRKRKTGRGSWAYEWLPTMKLITVDRSPVTREWTSYDSTGTSPTNQAITVESVESIEFAVGVNITGMVLEEDASKFLYTYAGHPLSEVMDTNIRSRVQTTLSREFGTRSLEEGRRAKKEIFDIAFKEVKDEFKKSGITITNMGLAEGMTYKDPQIQRAINNVFEKKMDAQAAVNEREAQQTRNKITVEIATAKRQAAQQFAMAAESQVKMTQLEIQRIYADVTLLAAKAWNGGLPANILPQGGGFLFSVGPVEPSMIPSATKSTPTTKAIPAKK